MTATGEGDYFPEGKRFGVLAISGYPDSACSFDPHVRTRARHGFSFWVVDTAEMCREVKKSHGVGETLDAPQVHKARQRAIAAADRLNRIDERYDGARAAA